MQNKTRIHLMAVAQQRNPYSPRSSSRSRRRTLAEYAHTEMVMAGQHTFCFAMLDGRCNREVDTVAFTSHYSLQVKRQVFLHPWYSSIWVMLTLVCGSLIANLHKLQCSQNISCSFVTGHQDCLLAQSQLVNVVWFSL